MVDIEKLKYQDELEENKFCVKFLSVMCTCCLLIWLANEVGIFVVNRVFMRYGMIIACSCLLLPVIIYFFTKGINSWFKYFVILSLAIASVSIQTFLTFHGVMLCVFPLLLASLYANKNVFKTAFFVSVLGIPLSVVLGYYLGCWDGNMIYATTYGITVATDSFSARSDIMTSEYMIQLLVYFAVPRMIIFCVISFCISYILKTSLLQYVRQNKIRILAECDGLTRLDNRTKYNHRVSGEYKKLSSVFVAYIDVNFLKKMNDICGHEKGDAVLTRVADEMKHLVCDTIHGYRLGGDEFTLVFCNYKQQDAQKIISDWQTSLPALNRADDAVHCSLSVGCAYAERPFDIEAVVKQADERMYENKIAMKAERTD